MTSGASFLGNASMTSNGIINRNLTWEKSDQYDVGLDLDLFNYRLKLKMALGSCATAYYGMGMDFDEVGIATSEMMSNINDYNTYILTSLPIGPISLPGLNAIVAAIKPDESDNLYFLSDNEGVTYFFETLQEQTAKKNELIQSGKWQR